MGSNRRVANWIMLAGVVCCLMLAGTARADGVAVRAQQHAKLQSAFTLNFDDLGYVSSANISSTDMELQIDPVAGTSRFNSYLQHAEPLILPGGSSTGNLTIEIVESLGGTFDRATGTFKTEDVYLIHFDGNLDAFGITSPFELPGSSEGVITFQNTTDGETLMAWEGTGFLPSPFAKNEFIGFRYTCTVNGQFSLQSATNWLMTSNPPHDAIDARIPHAADNVVDPLGWTTADLRFTAGTAATVTPADLMVQKIGGDGIAPEILAVDAQADDTFRVTLSNPIEPGTWTKVTHLSSGTSMCLGALPADVNGDGYSGPADILELIDHLNGVLTPGLGDHQCDVDRSGACAPGDILMVIDLLNGAGSFERWNGATLPPSPCSGQ